jgi:hypothetical protein
MARRVTLFSKFRQASGLLVLAWLVASIVARAFGQFAGLAFLGCGLAIALVPIAGFRIGSWAMGLLGPTSAAGVTLLAVAILTLIVPEVAQHGLATDPLALAILVLALPLQALALGALRFDLYRLGYKRFLLPALAAIAALLASSIGAHAIAFWLGLGIVMMLFRWYVGRNRFDALIDMGAVIGAVLLLIS